MGEHQNITGDFPRLELAQHLETLAKKLRLGKVRLGDQEFQVPELLTANIKLKEKDGQVKVKLRLAFPVQAAPDAAVAAEKERPQVSFKEVKNQLAAVFGELLKGATSGTLPQESRIEAYLELSREFARQADPACSTEVQEFLDHVENLRLAFQNRQVDMFQHELRDLQNRMKICHRDFK